MWRLDEGISFAPCWDVSKITDFPSCSLATPVETCDSLSRIYLRGMSAQLLHNMNFFPLERFKLGQNFKNASYGRTGARLELMQLEHSQW